MAQTIKLKRSATQNAVPSTSQLELGEVAINTYDGKMYIKKNDGSDSIVEIGGDATSSSGLDFTGNLNLEDNVRIVIGDGNDLQIYHDGSDSYITDGGTGNLKIQADDLVFKTADGSKEYLKGTASGSVRIRHNNSTKFETTSTGVTVTGTLVADGLDLGDDNILNVGTIAVDKVKGDADDNTNITFAGNDVTAFYQGGAEKIRIDADGRLLVNTTSSIDNFAKIQVVGDSSSLARITLKDVDGTNQYTYFEQSGGGTRINTQNGTSNGFFTIGAWNGTASSDFLRIDSSGNVGIGTTAPSKELHIASIQPDIRLQDTDGTNHYSDIMSSAGNLYLQSRKGADDGKIIFRGLGGGSATEFARFDSNGNFSIGNTNSGASLVVQSNSNAQGILIFGRSSDDISQLDFVENDGTSIGGFQARTTDFRIRSIQNLPLLFMTNNTERARIDISNNFLVGKTSSAFNTAGAEIATSGRTRFTRDSANVVEINRTTNAGSIITFNVDGSMVGNIGSNAARLFIHNNYGNGSGFRFDNGSINPASSSGANEDNTTDLGTSSVRFKDLHLSGQVNTGTISSSGTGTSSFAGPLTVGGTTLGNAFEFQVNGDTRITNFLEAGTAQLGNTTLTGFLRGPSTFTIDPATHGDDTGTVVIAGNLQVDGTTTTINSTTLTVDDKNITLASGSSNAAAANGAGITVDCGSDTDATLTYVSATDDWKFDKPTRVSGLSNAGIAFTSTETLVDGSSALPNGRIFYHSSRLIYDSPSSGHRFAVAGNQGTNLALEIYSNRDIGFYNSSGAADLFWDASTSRLGIGTTSPTHALHIVRSSASSEILAESDTGYATLKLDAATGAGSGVRFLKGGTEKVRLQSEPTSHDLSIRMSGTPKVTLTQAGSFGIGTTSPSTQLHVSSTSTSTLTVQNTTNAGNASLHFRDESNVDQYKVLYDLPNNRAEQHFNGNGLRFYSNQISAEVAKIGFGTNYNTSYFAGRVGVGTTSPSVPLHVDGSVRFDISSGENFYLYRSPSSNLDINLGSSNTDFNSAGTINFKPEGTTIQKYQFKSADFIVNGPNVGISTTTPEAKLHTIGHSRLDGAVLQKSGSSITSGNISTNNEYISHNGPILTNGSTANINQYGYFRGYQAVYGTDGTNGFNPYAQGAYSKPVFEFISNNRGSISLPTDAAIRGGYLYQFVLGNNGGGANSGVELTSSNTTVLWGITSSNHAYFANNVGIGTTSPANKLSVNTSANGDGIDILSNNTKIGTFGRTVNGSTVVASLDGVSGRAINIGGNVNTSVILGAAGGKVGIGTSSPSSKLTVNGSVSSGAITANDGASAAVPLTIGSGTSTNYTLQRWITTAHSGTTVYAIAYGAAHASQAGNFAIKNLASSGEIFFELTNNIEPLRFASNGAATFNKAFTLPTSDGSANQVLKTDGSGNVTWATEAAVSANTSISDADGDTKIQVEEGTDDDTIRFDTAGSQRMMINSSGRVRINNDNSSWDGLGTLLVKQASTNVGIGIVDQNSSNTLQLRNNGTYSEFYYNVNNPIVFSQQGGERMRINSSGYVGIGTNNPIQRLQVAGSIYANGGNIYIDSGNRLVWGNSQQFIEATNSGPMQFGTGNAERMRIETGGNVGIGTTSPSSRLNVVHSTNATNGITVQNATTGTAARSNLRLLSDAAQLDIYATSSTYSGVSSWADAGVISTSSNASGGLIFNAQATGHIFQTGTNERMRINSSGNVGIGTSSPTAKLDVNGSLKVTGTSTLGVVDAASFTDVITNTIYTASGSLDIDTVLTGRDVTFTQGSTNLMTIKGDASGVGIGTTSPEAKLQVAYNGGHTSGDISISQSNLDLYNPLEANTNEKGAILTFSDHYQDPNGYPRTVRAAIKGGTDTTGNTADGFLAFYTDSGSANSATERMRITRQGRLGIGTTSPSQALQVDGNVRINHPDSGSAPAMTATLEMYGYEGRGVGLKLRDQQNSASGSSNREWFVGTGYSQSNFNIGYSATGSQSSYAANNKLTVTTSGSIGIGTSAPEEKLHVETGSIFVTPVSYASNRDEYIIKTGAHNSSNWDGLGFKLKSDGSGVPYISVMGGVTTETMVWKSGNVGIGTASPASNLHVKTFVDNSVSQGIIVERSANSDRGYINYNGGAFQFRSTVGDPIVFGETDAEHLRILPDGNIGMGTTSVSSALSGSNRTFKIEDDDGADIRFVHTGGADFTLGVTNSNTAYVWNTGSHNILFGTNATERMRIGSTGRIGINTTSLSADGLHIGTTNGNCELDLQHTGASGTRWRFNSTSSGHLYIQNKTDVTTPMAILDDGRVGVGTTAPAFAFHAYHATTNVVSRFESGDSQVWIDLHDSNSGTYGALLGHDGNAGQLFSVADQGVNRRFIIDTSGQVSIGTNVNPVARLQVEALGIDTTTTTTSATTQVAIDTMAAATFRSAKYTIQVTNTTDSSYHVTEILLIHDGTTPGITEYGTVFTGSTAEATFDADISSGNVRLLATPASTDSMTFKVVRHCITV